MPCCERVEPPPRAEQHHGPSPSHVQVDEHVRRCAHTELVRAIRAVGAGESLLDPAVTTSVLDRLRKGKHLMKDERLARLSPQEERILTLIADGRTNREVGNELGLAEKTVKNYVSSILSKLEVARRAEAAAYLARHTTTPGSVE